MSKVICIFSNKGGVSKTTTAQNMSAVLANKGHSVLIIDMDVQANCTSLMTDDQETSVLNLLTKGGDTSQYILGTRFKNIDILPMSNKDVQEEIIHIDSFIRREKSLKTAIADIKGKYDFIVIDCPPALNEFTKNAIVASDFVVIPLMADKYAFDGLTRLIETLKKWKVLHNPNIKLLGIFLSKYTKTRVNDQTKELLKIAYEDLILKTNIRMTTQISESTYNAPVVYSKPYSDVSYDYKRLTEELLGRMV